EANDTPSNWEKYLDSVVDALNRSPSSVHGFPPALVLRGWLPVSQIDRSWAPEGTFEQPSAEDAGDLAEAVRKFLVRRSDIAVDVRRRRVKVQRAQMVHWDKATRSFMFGVGSRVWVHRRAIFGPNWNVGAKFTAPWFGPLIVSRHRADHLVRLMDSNGTELRRDVHMRDLKDAANLPVITSVKRWTTPATAGQAVGVQIPRAEPGLAERDTRPSDAVGRRGGKQAKPALSSKSHTRQITRDPMPQPNFGGSQSEANTTADAAPTPAMGSSTLQTPADIPPVHARVAALRSISTPTPPSRTLTAVSDIVHNPSPTLPSPSPTPPTVDPSSEPVTSQTTVTVPSAETNVDVSAANNEAVPAAPEQMQPRSTREKLPRASKKIYTSLKESDLSSGKSKSADTNMVDYIISFGRSIKHTARHGLAAFRPGGVQ
ncbi:hypothetical protein GQ42DRAFT_159660, partial [Ramicandelaber brevisporus]